MTSKRKQSVPDEPGFEASMGRLEQIVESLEQGGGSLDEVMALYEEGIRLAKRCTQYLNEAELKLKRLSKERGAAELVEDEPSN